MRKPGASGAGRHGVGAERSLVHRIRAFQWSVQANRRCADCTERGPTYICLNFQTFVCQTCSGIHRSFGHKIKGISLSDWSPKELEGLEAGGNERAAQAWLARWTSTEFPEPESGQTERVKDFIRMKYVDRRWWRQPPPAPQTRPPQPKACCDPGKEVSTPERSAQKRQAADANDLLSGLMDAGAPATPLVALAPPPASPSSGAPAATRGSAAPAAEMQWTADFDAPAATELLEAATATAAPPVLAPAAHLVAVASSSAGGLLDLDFSSGPAAAPTSLAAVATPSAGAAATAAAATPVAAALMASPAPTMTSLGAAATPPAAAWAASPAPTGTSLGSTGCSPVLLHVRNGFADDLAGLHLGGDVIEAITSPARGSDVGLEGLDFSCVAPKGPLGPPAVALAGLFPPGAGPADLGLLRNGGAGAARGAASPALVPALVLGGWGAVASVPELPSGPANGCGTSICTTPAPTPGSHVESPVMEPAEEPAPAAGGGGTGPEGQPASLGDRLREAVLSSSGEELKDLFRQCLEPEPAPKKAVATPDRFAAFAAFDELGGGTGAGGAAGWRHDGPRPPEQGPLPQMSWPQTPPPGTPGLGLAHGASPWQSSPPSVGMTPQQLAQLMPQNGMIAPQQLEHLNHQELMQMQLMISQAMQARGQHPWPAAPPPSPAPALGLSPGLGGVVPATPPRPPPGAVGLAPAMATPGSVVAAAAAPEERTPSPPKPFDDLLAAFHARNPISGVELRAS